MTDSRKLDAILAQFAHLTAELEDAAAVAVDGQGAPTTAEASAIRSKLVSAIQSIAGRLDNLRVLIS